jgi:hypothetical protein
MRTLSLLVAVLLAVVGPAGCGGAEEVAPDENSLKDSFSEQIQSVGLVRGFQRNGDELTFSGPYGREADAAWRIHIDSTLVERQDDERQPYKGTVKSSWYVNGTKIEPRGTYADLPTDFLDKGVSQDCWAFWEAGAKRWGWV